MKKKRVTDIFIFTLCVIILLIFSNRLFYTLSFYDEVGNIALAYRIVLGQKPLIDLWEFHQTGDFFAVPFVWIYTLINGNMEGIVLFMRLSYMFVNVIIASILYSYIKNIFKRYIAMPICLAIITYAPFSLYYLWYDTSGILFMLLGCIFILKASGQDSLRRKNIFLILAGIIHACMCYAYPSFLAVVFIYVLLLIFENRKMSRIWGYFCGGIIIVAIFSIFVAYNFNDIFLFNKDIFTNSSTGRSFSFLERVNATLYGCFYYFKPLFLEIIILNFIFCKSNNSKQKKTEIFWKIAFIIGIITFPIKTLLSTGSLAIFLYFFWLFLWTPLLVRLLSVEKRKIALQIVRYLWVPSVVSVFMVGFTAYGGGVKAAFGAYVGSISAIVIMGLVVDEIINDYASEVILNKYFKLMISLLLVIISINNVVLFYKTGFEGQNVHEANYKIQTGIFKDIYTKKEHAIFEDIEQTVKASTGCESKSIFFLDGMQYGYLFTDLLPMTSNIWCSYNTEYTNENEWKILELYFEMKGYPDIIVCKEAYTELRTAAFKNMLDNCYVITVCDNGIIIYLRKELC